MRRLESLLEGWFAEVSRQTRLQPAGRSPERASGPAAAGGAAPAMGGRSGGPRGAQRRSAQGGLPREVCSEEVCSEEVGEPGVLGGRVDQRLWPALAQVARPLLAELRNGAVRGAEQAPRPGLRGRSRG